MKDLTWTEIKNQDPKEYLTESEFNIYENVVKDFTERIRNMNNKSLRHFAENGLGIASMRYARQFADAHKQPNLYKACYHLIFNYKYD